MQYFDYEHSFELENGEVLPGIRIAFQTYGQLNHDKSNVVWVCHALTANSNVTEWWPGVVNESAAINPSTHFIICANIIGSCYGSTGPLSADPVTGNIYYSNFPAITIRDIVKAHIILRKHLGIEKIGLLMGGSMGGYQVLEWAVMEKDVIGRLFLIATSAAESAWGIAIHTAQRLSIEADPTWRSLTPHGGQNGLKAARAIGMLTYRNYGILVSRQTDPDAEKMDNFRASSYINYQGEKLVNRFNAYSYWLLTKTMDSHNLARGRGGDIRKVLKGIKQPALVVGISSDILCPVPEQKFLVEHLANSKFVEIDSEYGHDGFIVEGERISELIEEFISRGR